MGYNAAFNTVCSSCVYFNRAVD